MEQEPLTCPFCGAPHREAIPVGTVQVKCKYCGGTILVPAYFGGAAQRCPNHPDVLAVGLCNDCGESFCDRCLSLYNVEHGTLYLCPSCFKVRGTDKATYAIILGVLVLLGGFFFIAFAPNPSGGLVAGVFFIGFFALPFLAWGVYRSVNPPRGHTLRERNEAISSETEARKAFGSHASVSQLYSRLLDDVLHYYEPKIAYEILERRISQYVLAGMSRQEAVKELAKEEGYI